MAKKKKIVIPLRPRRAKKKGQEKKWYMDKIMIGARGTRDKKHRCDASHLFPSKPNYNMEK